MDDAGASYGLWLLVFVNSAVFIIFAFSFFKPQTKRDWRTFSAFSAFLVALFVEMYGFPLTIYLLSGWLETKLAANLLTNHDAGHLWHTLLGLGGNPHVHPIHWLSHGFTIGGFILLASSWKVLFAAQRAGKLARTGPYGYVRHPQYIAFIVIMFGFLIQWPTILTLLMFPVLVVMYVRLAHREEREVATELGDTWRTYAERTPRWIPRLGGGGGQAAARGGG